MTELRRYLLALALMLFTLSARADAKMPFYMPEGSIPGTSLEYSALKIGRDGEVSVSINNPTNKGVNFSANFSFFSKDGSYVCGFVIPGYAGGKTRNGFALFFEDYRLLSRASYMKVLGRAGIASDN